MEQSVSTAVIVSALISLLVEWFAPFAVWWHSLTTRQKQIYMSLAVAIISAGTVGVNCAAYQQCPADWIAWTTELFLTFLAAAAANQAVHSLSKRSDASVAKLIGHE